MFCVVEGVALYRKAPGDTLSEHVWRVFRTDKMSKPTGSTRLRRFILLAFMAWLSVHFLTGGMF